jgi:hypothetical protein
MLLTQTLKTLIKWLHPKPSPKEKELWVFLAFESPQKSGVNKNQKNYDA